jgi:hypothetical protein
MRTFPETFAQHKVAQHEFNCRAAAICKDMQAVVVKSRQLIYKSREVIARATVLLETSRRVWHVGDE